MGVPWQPVVQPRLRVHHGQGRLGHAGSWISGNREERQGTVRRILDEPRNVLLCEVVGALQGDLDGVAHVPVLDDAMYF